MKINPWTILKTEGTINENVTNAFKQVYGKRGLDAVNAVNDNRVKKYLDFFVVIGKTGEYYIEDNFCSCDAHMYGRKCWHTLAVGIAKHINAYETCNSWYYEKFKI